MKQEERMEQLMSGCGKCCRWDGQWQLCGAEIVPDTSNTDR